MQSDVAIDRDRYIGGSDIPIIMNLSPFKKRYELLREKAGLVESSFKGNKYTEYGNVMEEKIREFCCQLYGMDFKEGRVAFEEPNIGTRIHTDGETEDTVLEIKTTDDVPEDADPMYYKHYLVQLLFYMVTEGYKPNGILAVYERLEDFSEEFDPFRLKTYEINIGDYKELVTDILEEVSLFKHDLQRIKDNPELTEQDFIPQEVIKVSRQIMVLEESIARMKQTENMLKDLKASLKEKMEEYKVKSWKTPNGFTITLVPDGEDKIETVEELDIEGLRRDLPELFKSSYDGGYMKMVEKNKKGKAGYIRITPPKEKDA